MLRTLARFIAPPRCVICRREGNVLCEECRKQLPVPPPPACFWCREVSRAGQTCNNCAPRLALDGLIVASRYEGVVHDLIAMLKYRRQRDAAGVLGGLLSPLLSSQFDIVTSVPVATTRLRQRGYNQSELIAKSVARKLSLPYYPLVRRRHNTQQVGKSRAERLEQVKGIFVARSASPRVLIIDDVLTTGATLNACARALKNAGATQVWGAVAARD